MKEIEPKPLPPIQWYAKPPKGFAAGAIVNVVLIVLAVAMAIVLRELFHHY